MGILAGRGGGSVLDHLSFLIIEMRTPAESWGQGLRETAIRPRAEEGTFQSTLPSSSG